MKPVAKPGKRHHYGDTNYYLLGFIVERITGKPFHEVMHELIFDPLGMTHAYMHGYSSPKEQPAHPAAGLYVKDIDFSSVEGAASIDYAGGSVVAPLSEFHLFMDALANHRIVQEKTLERMINDDIPMGFPTVSFDYGYSIWKPKSIPVLMPPEIYCWGCVGVTGAFMFYHPGSESCVIGTFNDFAYRAKALTFMVRSVIRELAQLAKYSDDREG
jgi:D-alanyl-D-alanine carboxypeptidase